MAAQGGMWAKPTSGVYKGVRVFITRYDLQKMQQSTGMGRDGLYDMIKKGGSSVAQYIDQGVARRAEANTWYQGRAQRSLAFGVQLTTAKKAQTTKSTVSLRGVGEPTPRRLMQLGRSAASAQKVQLQHLSSRAQKETLLRLGQQAHADQQPQGSARSGKAPGRAGALTSPATTRVRRT